MHYSPNKTENWFNTSKKIATLAMPMAGSQLMNVASTFICMAMLSALGPKVLAASALIFSTQLSIMLMGMSLLFSTGILAGRAFGAKNYFLAGTYLQQSWVFALLISIPIVVVFGNIEKVFIFFNQPPEIAKSTSTYFHAYAWTVIPSLLSTCNTQFGYSVQQRKLVFLVNILSVTLLLVTAYALIFGKMGMPQIGIAGLGIATTIQYGFFFIVTTFAFYYKKDILPFHLFQYRVNQNLNYLRQMIRIGWPIFLQTSGEMLSFFVGSMMMGWLGTNTLAAFQVVNQYYFLLVIPVFSLSQASSILIGQAYGAKELQLIPQLGYASIVMVLIVSLLILSLFLTCSETLARFYIDIAHPENNEILQIAVLIFSLTAFSQIFDSLRKLLTGLLRGLLNTKLPMMISLFTLWGIGVPLSYLLAFIFQFGIVGYLIGGMLGMIVGVIILGWRWYIQVENHNTITVTQNVVIER